MFGGDDIGFLVRINDYEQADGQFFVTVEGIERFYIGDRWYDLLHLVSRQVWFTH